MNIKNELSPEKTPTSPQNKQVRPGILERSGRWLDDHWHAGVYTLGVSLMGLFGVLLREPKWYWWVGFVVGFVVSIIGTVFGVRDATKASEFKTEIISLSKKLKNARDPRRIFLVTAALTEDWQVPLLHDLLVQIRSQGLRPTVLAPLRNYSPQEQDVHFREINDRKDDYIGGIVIPIVPEGRRQTLRDFVDEFDKPVVFVDNAPFNQEDMYPPKTRFIGVNNSDGGMLAAKAVMASSNLIRKVLVIAGNTQVNRQISFKNFLAQSFPNCVVVIDEGGLFDSELAFRVTQKHIQTAIETNEPFDAVFCTSDSMTIGCLDAIRSIKKWGKCQKPCVFGYDGIDITLKLVEDPSSPLERVVVQDTHSIAVAVVENLVRLVNGEDLSGPEWIEPRLYPSLEMR